MHVPVLLQSTIEQLDIQPEDVVLDATLGLGGHSLTIARLLGPKGLLIGLDADASLLAKAQTNLLAVSCQKIFINQNFRHLKTALDSQRVTKVDKVLFDLGLNSEHFDVSGRGFSFQKDEPLLMTLVSEISEETLTAKDIVNTWSEESLADIIFGYGEERLARRIAKAIILAREDKPINTTSELVQIIKSVMPAFRLHSKTHFATKTFQALRIAVNDELGALKEALAGTWQVLGCGGRVAAISFHSLEARVVKDFFKQKVALGEAKLITKKAIKPSREEELSNPRSRSAQLRVLMRVC